MLKQFINNYRAYNAFLHADGFSPVVNELGNLVMVVIILVVSNWLGLLIVGIPLVLGLVVFQKIEAYQVGRYYLRSRSMRLTKEYIKSGKKATR